MVPTHKSMAEKKSKKTTEALFGAAEFWMRTKKAFSDREVFKEAMTITANTTSKDAKNGSDVISTLSDVQPGSSSMVRRVSAMSDH